MNIPKRVFIGVCILLVACGLAGVSGRVAAKAPRLTRSSHVLDHTRIMGGNITTQGQFPSMVTLYHHTLFGKRFLGAGTLINANHVLTSAQTIQPYSPSSIEIIVGEQNLDVSSGLEQSQRASASVVHDYTTTTGANNIGILETAEPFIMEEGVVQAVPLPTDYQVPTGECVAVGWGYTENGDDLGPDLRFVKLPYVPDQECIDLYGPDHVLLDMMCAGETGGADVCFGDGGGPLFCDGVQMGITTNSLLCDATPTIFTEVSHFLDWIKIHS